MKVNKIEEHFAFSAEEMQQLGASLAERFLLPSVVYLNGDLGAGKTTLVQGIAQFYQYGGVVSSPSYNLIHEYPCAVNEQDVGISHLDLYRIENSEELDMLGLADLLTDQYLLLVEWSEKGQPRLPECQYSIDISIFSDGEKTGRRIEVGYCS